jgi:membrane protein YqaA with SNARE-associated domain
MRGILRSLAGFFFSLGGIGLLLLGILDSSFLFMPLGNDLLIVGLTANHHERMLYYAMMATTGSVIGVAITEWASRKGGQAGLEGGNKSRRVAYVERKVKKNAGMAIGVAALMPPPFPFTPFVIVAAALQYPRKKMLSIIAGCRAVRFVGEGWLALIYGRRIIDLAKSPWVQRLIIGLVVVSIVGSVLSVMSWIRKSHKASAAEGR